MLSRDAPKGKEGDFLKKFVLKKQEPDLDPEYNISPELAKMEIVIHSEGYPKDGALYYTGTVRKFIIERIPSPALIEMLPRLLTEPKFSYCLSTETIIVARDED